MNKLASLFITAGLVLAVVAILGLPLREGPVLPGHSTADPATQAPPPPAPEGERPDVTDGLWYPAGESVSLAVPEGWTDLRRGRRPYLCRDAASLGTGNFNLIQLPNLFGKSIDGLREENRAELEANPAFELESIEDLSVDGHTVLRIDYSGRPRGTEQDYRFVGLVWLQGGDQMVLTAAARAEAWADAGPDVEAAIESLRLGVTRP